jgi:hypothetical protein
MNAPPDAHEQQIIRSWNANAKPWTRAIQAGSIHSRKLVTDRAIVDAVPELVAEAARLGQGEFHVQDHGGVQTLHPLAACGDNPYQDGWRAGIRHFYMQGSHPGAD